MPRPNRHWLRWIAALTFIALAAGALYVYVWTQAGTSAGDVERLLDAHLSPGASREEIAAFLDSQGMIVNTTGKASDYSELAKEDIDLNDQIIVSLIQDAGNELIGATDIYVYFVLGPDGRMLRYIVKEHVISL